MHIIGKCARLSGRVLWACTKFVFGIVFAFMLFAIAWIFLSFYFFAQECKSDDEGAWAKPIEPANSMAYDMKGIAWGSDSKGCGGSYSYCIFDLISQKNRREFVEVLVHKPDADYLSKKKGWHRYWLASPDDPACSLFYASEKAQANWHGWFANPHTNPDHIDPDAICIASKKIDKPESRYLYRKRDDIEKKIFDLSIWRNDLIDQHTGEIKRHWQRSHFGLEDEFCSLPEERYEAPGDRFPQSSLAPLSGKDWPTLPEAFNTSE